LTNQTGSQILRFGPYEVYPRSQELFKHGVKLKVRPQALRLLTLMLRRPGEVLTREEIQKELWSAETFVDFEHSLNAAVKALRSVLSDSVTEPRYIETLPKIGYRFMAAVTTVAEAPEPTAGVASPGTVAVDQPRTEGMRATSVARTEAARSRPSTGRVLWVASAAALLVAAVIAGYYSHLSSVRSRTPGQVSGRRILAILPFQNLSGGADEDYFSDGLTEELIAQFGMLDPQHLGVIARTSVMHYKHSDEPLDQIGRELGVQYALEGSVRRNADKVRISAQLIQLKDQTRLWSREYDRELSDLLTLQSQIARDIDEEIRRTLGDPQPAQSAQESAGVRESYEAYDLYLKGLYFWNKRTMEGLQRATEYFQQATDKDPRDARAYAGLADCYVLLSGYSGRPPGDLIAKGRAAAQKAVALDDALAEAHTAKAVVAQDFDWDWKTAEREYLRAIELNPNYATARHWYAEYLGLMGRFDEAGVEIEQARQLDPLSLIIATDHGVLLYYARQYDQAIVQFRTVLEMDPRYPRTNILDYVYLEKGMKAEALAHFEEWRAASDPSPWFLCNKAYLLGRLGKLNESRAERELLLRANERQPVDPLLLAISYLGTDDKKEALGWLEKAYTSQSVSLTSLKVDPMYDALRGEPRFQALLRAMNLGG
jgi:TolB-like protein/DNA-binding winged helix-turn-helix (wHTH) protein/lipoprotein NlpI